MNKPHKHAELIKQWADGAEIEYLSYDEWIKIDNPSWSTATNYRIADPYHELKEAYAACEVIQLKAADGAWYSCYPDWRNPPERYRIKPKTVKMSDEEIIEKLNLLIKTFDELKGLIRVKDEVNDG